MPTVGNIRWNETHLCELDAADTTTTRVPLAEVRALALADGFTSERPIVQLVVGFMTAAVFFVGFVAMVVAPLFGGGFEFGLRFNEAKAAGHLYGGLALMGFLSVYALRTAFARGAYLRIETTRGVRKLIVAPLTDRVALMAALDELAASGFVVRES